MMEGGGRGSGSGGGGGSRCDPNRQGQPPLGPGLPPVPPLGMPDDDDDDPDSVSMV